MEKIQRIARALREGLVVATGCTEPVAVAYAAAVARSHTNGDIERIILDVSPGVVKNAFAVMIPGAGMTGLDNAAALGAALNNPQEKLALLGAVSKEKKREAQRIVGDRRVTVNLAEAPMPLYIKVTVITGTDTATAEIVGSHTNVSKIVKNGEEIFNGNCNLSDLGGVEPPREELPFTLMDIFDFCASVPLEELEVIRAAIELNTDIAKEGLHGDYGLRVGKTIRAGAERGVMADDITNYAMMLASAGSDARMAGATMPVMSNSGSGNQGIAATVPVVAVWEKLGGGDEERLVRACAISNLVTIYIKSKFGVLSALCSAVIAGTGVACAVVYLMDGDYAQMEMAVRNVLANVSGILCDGAKSSCALKISSCVNAAMQAAMLAMSGLTVGDGEGIIEKLSEGTIDNFAVIGKVGAKEIDRMMLDMIMGRSNAAPVSKN